jgi:hypothetical protein
MKHLSDVTIRRQQVLHDTIGDVCVRFIMRVPIRLQCQERQPPPVTATELAIFTVPAPPARGDTEAEQIKKRGITEHCDLDIRLDQSDQAVDGFREAQYLETKGD